MRVSTIEDRFQDLLDRPGSESLLAARDLVIAHDNFPISPVFWARLDALLAANSFSELLAYCRFFQAVACLSPRFHFCRAIAYDGIGDAGRRDQSKATHQKLLKALADTGDGTQAAPFIITYLSDEYDLMKAFGCEAVGHHTAQQHAGVCDVITDANGDEFWFDASALLSNGPMKSAPKAVIDERMRSEL